jgi:hypothetical protein
MVYLTQWDDGGDTDDSSDADDIESSPSGDWHVAQAEVDWLVSDAQKMIASLEGRHNTIEGQVDRPLGEDIASPGPDEDAEGEDEPIDGEDAEGEQDQLIDDDGEDIANPGPDEDAEGEDEPIDGEEGADHEPSGGEGVEQGAIVSLYLIPSIKLISRVYFGLTEWVGNN